MGTNGAAWGFLPYPGPALAEGVVGAGRSWYIIAPRGWPIRLPPGSRQQ